MDGTPESIITVIGSPIAGNPSQFAVERALRSLGLDWRVLSFDVKPDDVSAALEGFSVTGIAGVLIDPSVSAAASRWYADKRSTAEATSDVATTDETTSDETTADETSGDETESEKTAGNGVTTSQGVIDCLYRDQERNLVGSCEQQAWVDRRIAEHGGENRIWLGDDAAAEPWSSRLGFGLQPIPCPPDPDRMAHADLIVIAETSHGPPELEVEDWPKDDGSTLVLDLTGGHPDQPTIQRLGYHVVTRLDRRIGTLQGCLQKWTGRTPSKEVIQDAIEEYLGV